MKPPPFGLPPANSRKWHCRRFWDGLGYFRDRSMGNPSWDRDLGRVLRFLESDRDRPLILGSIDDRPLFDEAISAVKRYPRTAAGTHDAGLAWDEVLEAVDRILVVRQARHMAGVRAAQAEGLS